MRVKIRKKSFGKLESLKKNFNISCKPYTVWIFKNFLPLTFYGKSMAVSNSQFVKIGFT